MSHSTLKGLPKLLQALGSAIVALAFSTACTPSAPITATGCEVRAVGNSKVAFEANLLSHSNKTATRVYVEVVTSGDSRIYYELNGRLLPDHSTHQRTIKNVNADPFSLKNHVSTITTCKVFAVTFQDGTHWQGPADM